MTYFVPLLDVLGNLPIWSVDILPVICNGLMCTTLVRSVFDVIAAGMFVVVADGGEIDFVDRMFILVLRICPFAVAIDLGRCFLTRSDVSPGHVVKKPSSMALIQVDGTGLKAAWCRYITKSRSVFWVYALFACGRRG